MRRLGLSLGLLLPLTAVVAAGAAPVPEGDTPVAWLAGYLRLDTSNPPGHEERAAAYLAAILHRHGVATTTWVTAAGRTSLSARLAGRHHDGALLLLHHLDVVPPGDGWSHDPFGGEAVDGELWGRGALDVKSLGVAQLAAFLDLAARPEPPAHDVVFLAVADEENGGVLGTAWLLDRHPELFRGVAAVLGEGGSNRRVNGRLAWWGVEVAQKRPLWLEVRTTGRGGHASGLHPHSAVHELVSALARMVELPPEWKVTAPVRRYLRALAPLHGDDWRRRFLDPDAWVGPEGPRGPMLPGQANLFLDSVQVTEIRAGDRINVVPDHASARVDVRLLPGTDPARFLDRLRAALGPEVAVEVLLSSPPRRRRRSTRRCSAPWPGCSARRRRWCPASSRASPTRATSASAASPPTASPPSPSSRSCCAASTVPTSGSRWPSCAAASSGCGASWRPAPGRRSRIGPMPGPSTGATAGRPGPPAEPRRFTRGRGLLEPWLARRRARQADRLLPAALRGGRILDLGCGSYPYFLSHTSFREKLAIDRQRPSGSPPDIEWHALDLNTAPRLPLPDAHLDAVTMLAVVEHLDPAGLVVLFGEIRRVLRPGGRLVVTTPAAWSDGLLRVLARLRLVSAEEIEEHVFAYTQPLLGWYFGRAGFAMERLRFGYFELGLNLWATADR